MLRILPLVVIKHVRYENWNFALGEQMESAFIWEQLDFANVDEETIKNWWKSSVTFPENFNYEKGIK